MTRPPTRARRALLALTALLTAVLAALAPTVAAALPAPASLPAAAPEAQQQTFGIQPASASGPDQRAALTYAATPGAQLKDHVAVYNYGDDPLTLSLYAADAFNTSTGGYDVLPASRTSTDVGAWIHLAVGTITLPPRTRQIVPFTLAVPANASPGDHSGGVVLALRRHTTDAKGNDITVDQRVGTRVHLRVPGALRPRLVVESVAVSYRGTLNPFGTGTTTVSYTVRNAGNIRLAGRQAVRVRNAVGGLTTASGPGALTELLPGNTETYTVQVRGVFPTLWSTASITVDPMAVPGDADPALPSAISDHVYATISWTLVAVVIVLLAIAVSLFLRFRRRRRYGPTGTPGPFGGPPAGPSSPPTGSPAPTPVPAPVPSLPAPASGGSVGEAPGPVAVPVPVPSGAPAPVPAPVPSLPAPASGGSVGEAPGPVAVPVPVPSGPPASAPTPGASLPAPASGGSVGEAPGPVAVPVPVPSGAPASAPTPGASGSVAAPLSAPASGGSVGEAAGPVAVPVPVPSGAPAPAPTPGASGSAAAPQAAPASGGVAQAVPRSVAAEPRRWGATRSAVRLGALGVVLVAALGGVVGGATAAVADGSSPTPSASGTADGASGTLWFDYASGRDDDPINVATSGRCPAQGTWLAASITGPGFPAGGASALGLSAASIYPGASTGGYVVPLDQTMRSIARQSGVTALHGAYRVDVYCRGRFLPTHLRDFVGTLTFAGSGGAWTADHATPVAMPVSSEPPATTTRPRPASTTARAARSGGISVLSVLAMVAGVLLLAGLATSALRRRRAQVLRERGAQRPKTAPQPDVTPKAGIR